MGDRTETLSRRDLLQAAGGVTLLALVPRLASATSPNTVYEVPNFGASGSGRPPIFTALPYLQPGAKSSQLVEHSEGIVIAWQTDDCPAQFDVTFGERGFDRKASISTAKRPHGKGDSETKINYAAALEGLNLNTKYRYRVSLNGETLLEGFFTTRKPRGAKTRFVAFGDNSYGDISDRAIAFQAFKAMPDFVMNAGDNVYESGLDNEYARYFFPVYNADLAGIRSGAPLLRAVPFYTVLANHDVAVKGPDKHPVADFTKNPDSLGYYTNMYLPLNGPAVNQPTPTVGNPVAIDSFKVAAGDRFPKMGNYSFDYGDGHFLCLDSNVYVDPTDPQMQAWIESDLAESDAPWKFVTYHHPAFNVGAEHYHEQQMRVLSPIFEKHGVVMVFSGHEHIYQRNRPIRFVPGDLTGAKDINSGHRLVPGTFTIDRNFDGDKATKPEGVIYITSGAGGKHLYDADMNQNPKNWLHEEDQNADYVAQLISDRHSLTVIDMDASSLKVHQVDQWGNEVDRIHVTR
ncbi:MAG TPA: metallophosphoesterase [Fimbriimonadaceae bacterium]|jgi:hypothetical protein